MSYGDGAGQGVKPLFGASWRQILTQLEVVKECVRPVQEETQSGGWIPFFCKSKLVLTADNSLLR